MHSMNLTAQLNPSTYTRKFSSCSLRRNPNCCLSAGRAGYFSNPGLLANTFTTTRVSSFSRGRARCVPTPPLCYSRKCSLARARQLDWQESAKARCDGRKVRGKWSHRRDGGGRDREPPSPCSAMCSPECDT